MKVTTQFNFRISKALVEDMDFVANSLNINRNDWLKVRIAELIAREKQTVIEDIKRGYLTGSLTDEEYKTKLGSQPSQYLKKIKEQAKKAAKKYLREALMNTKSHNL